MPLFLRALITSLIYRNHFSRLRGFSLRLSTVVEVSSSFATILLLRLRKLSCVLLSFPSMSYMATWPLLADTCKLHKLIMLLCSTVDLLGLLLLVTAILINGAYFDTMMHID